MQYLGILLHCFKGEGDRKHRVGAKIANEDLIRFLTGVFIVGLSMIFFKPIDGTSTPMSVARQQHLILNVV